MKKLHVCILTLLLVFASGAHAFGLKADKKWLEIGLRVSGMSFNSSDYPHKDRLGIVSYENILPSVTAQINFNNSVSMEASLLGSTNQQLQSFAGDLGGETVTYGQIKQDTGTLTAKFYPDNKYRAWLEDVSSADWYVGVGLAYTNISGKYRVNGTELQTFGGGVSTVFQGGLEVPLIQDWATLNIDLKKMSVILNTPVGGGREITTRNDFIVSGGILFRFFSASR